MKKLIAFVGVAALMVVSSGCLSLNWHHNRRHVRKVVDDLQELHQDIDKIIFGLERNPAE